MNQASGFGLARPRPAEQLETAADKVIAHSRGNRLQQLLKRRVLEFRHATAFDIDQMVMLMVVRPLVTRPTAAEVPPVKDAVLLKKSHGPIDSRYGNTWIDGHGAPIKLLNIGMIV